VAPDLAGSQGQIAEGNRREGQGRQQLRVADGEPDAVGAGHRRRDSG